MKESDGCVQHVRGEEGVGCDVAIVSLDDGSDRGVDVDIQHDVKPVGGIGEVPLRDHQGELQCAWSYMEGNPRAFQIGCRCKEGIIGLE